MTVKNIIFFFSLFLLGMPANSFAQTTRPYPFVPHENLHLVFYYNLGPLWVHAGDADLKTDTVTYEGMKSIRFIGTGHSLKKYAFIFKLEDYYQSITTIDGFKPLYYEKNTLEGGYFIHNIYHFHWGRKNVEVRTEATRHPPKDTVLTLNKTFRDVLSATYYLRITSALKVDDTLAVPLIIDGKKKTYYIIYAGKGKMVRKRERIPCNVYKAAITSSTFFSDTDPLVVFVTADKNRYPIYVDANIIVGTVKIFLQPYLDFKPKFKAHKR